jgi:hypothetical protein
MEYGELFNEAFDLYKRNFSIFFGIGAVVFIPFGLLSALAIRSQVGSALVNLIFLVPLVAAYGAIVKALADRYLGKPATIASSWSYILRRLAPYFFTMIVAGLLVTVGFFLLCVPGIIFAFWVAFVVPVIVVEDRYYWDAIQRSRELAAGQWMRIFVVALLTSIMSWVISAAVMAIFGLILGVQIALSPGMGQGAGMATGTLMAWQIAYGLIQAALTPITSLLVVLLYFDVRVRKEGYDIQLLAEEMGELPPGSGPSIRPA